MVGMDKASSSKTVEATKSSTSSKMLIQIVELNTGRTKDIQIKEDTKTIREANTNRIRISISKVGMVETVEVTKSKGTGLAISVRNLSPRKRKFSSISKMSMGGLDIESLVRNLRKTAGRAMAEVESSNMVGMEILMGSRMQVAQANLCLEEMALR